MKASWIDNKNHNTKDISREITLKKQQRRHQGTLSVKKIQAIMHHTRTTERLGHHDKANNNNPRRARDCHTQKMEDMQSRMNQWL